MSGLVLDGGRVIMMKSTNFHALGLVSENGGVVTEGAGGGDRWRWGNRYHFNTFSSMLTI